MKIAFVSTMSGAPWGGSEELWSQSALRLARMGCHVTASFPYWKELQPVLGTLIEAGGVLERRPLIAPLWQRALVKLLQIPWQQYWSRRTKQFLLRVDPWLVCISQGGSVDGLGWMLCCLEAQIPYVVIAHSVSSLTWPDDSVSPLLLRAYRSAKRCFFVSQRSRQMFQTHIGEELGNSQIVRNPFKVPYDVRLDWPESVNEWRLACVGRLDPSTKAQDLLLQVLADKKWQKRPIKATVYGAGPFENTIRKLSTHLGCRNVRFHGHTEDIPGIWRQNHALIMPSRVENLPLTLVEAMLCSRLAIVTDVGGITEFVEHGLNGFVAPAATVAFIDAALEQAWQRREQWQEMGLAARSRVLSMVPEDPVKDFCEQLVLLAAPQSREV